LNHKFSIEQLIHRDRNHPSVVMWSIANEPRTSQVNSDQYFGEIARYTKELDPSRPITAAIAVNMNTDQAAKHLDIVSFNRYNAWYQNTGKLDMITSYVLKEARDWYKVSKFIIKAFILLKPIMCINSFMESLY
jgi:beta-glucuronidase